MLVEHFKNPPIVEALLDIQVALPGDVSLEELKGFHAGLENRFPETRECVSWPQGFQLSGAGESQAASGSRSVDGYLFSSKAEGKVVQARCDGFTFNQLAPYTNWDAFSSEARELWLRYARLARPASIRRLSLRYLNQIGLPLPVRDLRDFCLLFPDIPTPLPQGLSEFFLRLTLPAPEGRSASIVTLTLEPPAPGATVINLVLDIEAVHVCASLNLDAENVWLKLAELRDLKNQVFGASLTESAKTLFR